MPAARPMQAAFGKDPEGVRTRSATSLQACAAGRADVGRSGPLKMPNLDRLGLGAAIRLASGAATPGLAPCPKACGVRRPRCRAARIRHRAIGNWRAFRCPGIGPIFPTPAPPFPDDDRGRGLPPCGDRRDPRQLPRLGRPDHRRALARTTCGRAARSAIPRPTASFRSRPMRRHSGLGGFCSFVRPLRPGFMR